MPIGIIIIMNRSKPSFSTAKDLANTIDNYFTYIEGEYHIDKKRVGDQAAQKVWDREPEPATIAGLALFLGFNSIHAFNEYEQRGRFANALKRGRLRIESVYEKKLHLQSATGAIFALKNMGWDKKEESVPGCKASANLKITIVKSGPELAGSEHEVIL
jgi:hypothetical protein